ncbi:ATP-dependent DNA helicase Q-like SIM isoform X4 [Pistacia vera]|uniref:ATP-dependent DNA helicase Q-like SIM isoform X4 n=1 Tax=Pistacia vera TaxID=55513 RepID=UPI00126342E6|nr:ATP-dependent DNA helicase Q-like SIM isoform X4 [Pistacia vera]
MTCALKSRLQFLFSKWIKVNILCQAALYANLLRAPTLLPSRRSEDQTKQAYKMLSDFFRYGMNTSCCRAKILVEYFGEDFGHDKCLMFGKILWMAHMMMCYV